MEKWKCIITKTGRKGKHSISNYGRAKINKNNEIIILTNNNRGYPTLGLKAIHKYVAEYFIGRPEGIGYEVNHKDLNKLNNHVDNLEYVTHAENMRHAYLSRDCKGLSFRPLLYIDSNGGVIDYFESGSKASITSKKKYVSECHSLASKNKKAKKHTGWVFEDEYERYLTGIEKDIAEISREEIINIDCFIDVI